MFWLALWWVIALVALNRWRKPAVNMLWLGMLALGLLGFRAIPDLLLRPLENRYSVPAAESIDQYVGFIVLGGALGHPESFVARGQVPLGDAVERMTVPVGLMRQHPKMQLVFSGGEGRLLTTGIAESELARAFYQQQGLPMERIRLESRARNTHENAKKVAKLLGDECRQPWLLVTSAWHMPRSMAEFDAVDCNVTPFPVDFTTGDSTALTEYSLAGSLERWQMALHEWLGMLAQAIRR